MLKLLAGLTVAVAILSTSGCCWPMPHGGRRYYSDRFSEAARPPPPGRPQADRHDGRH